MRGVRAEGTRTPREAEEARPMRGDGAAGQTAQAGGHQQGGHAEDGHPQQRPPDPQGGEGPGGGAERDQAPPQEMPRITWLESRGFTHIE